jgi:C1A family cysteine protease
LHLEQHQKLGDLPIIWLRWWYDVTSFQLCPCKYSEKFDISFEISYINFLTFQDIKGLNIEQSYPYEAANLKCRQSAENDEAKDNQGYLGIFPNETLIKLIVTNVGPVAVALHVSEKFMHYQSGIYNEPNCSKTINHAVLIVGYGTEKGQDYWIVKNSWGMAWGEAGYFRIVRGDNHCGIALYATYPLV